MSWGLVMTLAGNVDVVGSGSFLILCPDSQLNFDGVLLHTEATHQPLVQAQDLTNDTPVDALGIELFPDSLEAAEVLESCWSENSGAWLGTVGSLHLDLCS